MLLKPSVWTIIVGSLLLVACDPEVDKALPSAAQAPQSMWLHDDQHVDPYAYLGDTEDPRCAVKAFGLLSSAAGDAFSTQVATRVSV